LSDIYLLLYFFIISRLLRFYYLANVNNKVNIRIFVKINTL
jgi:hypothetical protein